VVFANRDEATRYTLGTKDPYDLGDGLDQHADVVAVKLGSEGCLIRHGGEVTLIRTAAIQLPVDTNGAGDAFEAGFLYGLCKGFSLDLCARIGNYYAAHVIQVLGAQSRVRLEGIEYLVGGMS
jgi:sugar/nucleoside kinase (ribokinase family)